MVLPSGVIAKILLKSKVIYDAHELESNKAGQSKILSKATLFIEKASWGRIDSLITVSPSISEWYESEIGYKPTACILNSPEILDDTRGSGASEAGLRKRLNIGPKEPIFVYVGALESGRGIELVLESFATSNARVHVAFVGAGGLRQTIEEASRHYPNVHYCAPVRHDKLVAFIHEATGGFCLIEDVSLSDHYCLPNKLFEYAFAGLPVIASRLPDIETFVKKYQLGTCVDLNIDSIRAAVENCIARPRDLSRDRLWPLGWQAQKEKLWAIYAELVPKRQA
jgi:glycosyltransferase involved in cell wall biosynthesis